MKKYYTKSKTGEEVVVSPELAKELVSSGKKTAADFIIEISGNEAPAVPQASSVDNNLYTKALQVGYSGLSKDEQSKLDYQYSKSDAAKTMKIEEVRAKMDANAAVSKKMAEENKPASGFTGWATEVLPEIPKAGYQAARDVIAKGLSPFAGALEYGWDRLVEPQHSIDSSTGKAVPDKKDYVQLMQEAEKRGQTGEGVIGLIAAPENMIPFSRLGTFGTIGAQGALAGGSHYLNEENPTLSGTAIATGIGATLGGLTRGILGAPERRAAQKAAEVEELALKSKLAQAEYARLKSESDMIADAVFGKSLTGNTIIDPLIRDAYKSTLGRLKSEIDLTRSPWLTELTEQSALNRAGLLQVDSRVSDLVRQGLSEKEAESALKSAMLSEKLHTKRLELPLYNDKSPGILGRGLQEGEKVPVVGSLIASPAKNILFNRMNAAEPLYPFIKDVGDVAVRPIIKKLDSKANKEK